MQIAKLLLQNFRSYESATFTFSEGVTCIVGPNTAGKSNIIESIYLLSHGKSFRTDKDMQMIQLQKDVARVKAKITHEDAKATILEVTLAEGSVGGRNGFIKKYKVNDIPKRRADFAGNLHALLFDPSDLDVITGSPSLRREFFDEVLEQTDTSYRYALLQFTKALRHRNALLQQARETGIRSEKEFAYWDELLIQTGNTLTDKRAEFVAYINSERQELFPFRMQYDKSEISDDRLLQYKEAELGAGVTLVGPHRDDFSLFMRSPEQEEVAIKSYGSRGQQRLAIVQMKLLQLQFMRERLSEQPVLLLDDIFSELDTLHIQHVLRIAKHQQTIITTTHKEFIDPEILSNPHMIELENAHGTI